MGWWGINQAFMNTFLESHEEKINQKVEKNGHKSLKGFQGFTFSFDK